MKINQILLSFVLACISLSCSEKTKYIFIGPPEYGDSTGSIFLSSFEAAGQPTMAGWNIQPTYVPDVVSFSNYVPIGGGQWSLRIQGKQRSYFQIYVQATLARPTADSASTYILSFWAKGKGDVWLMLGVFDNVGWIVSVPFDTTSWTYYADTLKDYKEPYNLVAVNLYGPYDDSTSSAFFDNIKVTRQPY